MIVDRNGNAECDRCGINLGLAPITTALIVSDLDDNGRVRTRHFCRIPVDGAPKGCSGKLMTPSNLAHANELDKEAEARRVEAEEADAERAETETTIDTSPVTE